MENKNGTKNLSMSRSKSSMSEIELAYMSRITRSYDLTTSNEKVIKEEIFPLIKLKDKNAKLEIDAKTL